MEASMPKRMYRPKSLRTATTRRHIRSRYSGGTYLWPKINYTKDPNSHFQPLETPQKP